MGTRTRCRSTWRRRTRRSWRASSATKARSCSAERRDAHTCAARERGSTRATEHFAFVLSARAVQLQLLRTGPDAPAVRCARPRAHLTPKNRNAKIEALEARAGFGSSAVGGLAHDT